MQWFAHECGPSVDYTIAFDHADDQAKVGNDDYRIGGYGGAATRTVDDVGLTVVSMSHQ